MTNQQAGYLKSLQILFSALLVGLLLATTVLYSTFEQPKVVQSDALSTDIIPLIMLSMIVVGYLFFNMRLKILANETDLNAKKTSYRNASLVKWAIFEGATMLALIGYFFLDIDVLLLGLVASLAHFAIHFPSRQRVLRELAIDDID
jgi:hypothetical protein